MSSTKPLRVSALQGRVTRAPYARGSKSEREAIFIETMNQKYLLRRKTGPAFGDTSMMQYVGHQVKCDGFVVDTTLLAEKIEIVD